MANSNENHVPGAPLPGSVVEMQTRRLTPFKQLLNDMI